MPLSPKFCKSFTYEKAYSENPYHNMDALLIRFIKVTFTEDFGPWKRGYVPYDLHFNPETMNLIESDQNELLVNSCLVELVINGSAV